MPGSLCSPHGIPKGCQPIARGEARRNPGYAKVRQPMIGISTALLPVYRHLPCQGIANVTSAIALGFIGLKPFSGDRRTRWNTLHDFPTPASDETLLST